MIFFKFLLALAGLCTLTDAFPSNELSVDSNGIDTPILHEFDTRADKPAPPSGRSLCSVNSIVNKRYTLKNDGGNDNSNKRSDVFELAEGNSTLSKRDMTGPENDSKEAKDKFMKAETADNRRQFIRGETIDGIKRDVNNAKFFSIERQRIARGLSMDHLGGCTGLLIASRRGVYAGHYWESIGFDLDEEIQSDLYANQEEAFQKSILDALKSGSKGHQSLAAKADKISDDSIHAYLMIPANGAADEGIGEADPSRPKWNEMKRVIGEIIPALADENKWTEFKYAPVEDEEIKRKYNKETKQWEVVQNPLEDTARGRMLFKFDPKHQGKKRAALWMEHKLMFEDEWE